MKTPSHQALPYCISYHSVRVSYKYGPSKVFDDKTATHVVTGIENGADAVLIFDKKVSKGSSSRHAIELVKTT